MAAQSNDSARTVRVAVLGAGAWARLAHIPGFKRDARCEVVAICDPQRHMAEALAAEFGIPSVYSDHREVLAREDIDLIDVCTPSATHFELSWAALEAGKHVLCEKPVAFDFRDTIRAAELAKEDSLVLVAPVAAGTVNIAIPAVAQWMIDQKWQWSVKLTAAGTLNLVPVSGTIDGAASASTSVIQTAMTARATSDGWKLI